MEEYRTKIVTNNAKVVEEHLEKTSCKSPLSFDVYTQPYEDYVSEFNEKRAQFGRFDLENETEYYQWLKDVADYLYKGIDYKNPPHEMYIIEKEIEREILRDKNPRVIYEASTLILEFLEKQKVRTNKNKKDLKRELKDFFYNVEEKEDFLLELKEVFTIEYGIDFSILMWLLKDANILIIGNREFKRFHEVATIHFTQGIGTPQSINDNYKHSENDKKTYKSNIQIISNKLKPLIIKYKVLTE